MSYIPPPTGDTAKDCTARAFLSQSGVSEIRVTYGGRRYEACPRVLLSNTYGTGGIITLTMSGTAPDPSSITHWEIIQGPPYDDEYQAPYSQRTQWSSFGPITATDTAGAAGSDGAFTHTGMYSSAYTIINPAVGLCGDGARGGTVTVPFRQPYKFTGKANAIATTPTPTPTPTGTIPSSYTPTPTQYAVPGGASCKINFAGAGVDYYSCQRTSDQGDCVCQMLFHYVWNVISVTALESGSGYDPQGTVKLTVCAGGGESCVGIPKKDLIVEGYGPLHPNNINSPRFSVASASIASAGTNYVVAPRLAFSSESGYGAAGYVTVKNGALETVVLTAHGGGYKTTPTVEVVSGGASAFAVMRPHLKGKYQCYYRYVDTTPEEKGGPVASNLSPVVEFDAGDGASQIKWTCAPPVAKDLRELRWELWRSTGDEATTLYRVHLETATPAATSTGPATQPLQYLDDLTDEELRDPDRDGYAAMPIILPNGDINAFRFDPPPADKSVVVLFRDRHWYGVDTSGTAPNTLLYSEQDEPESVPKTNDVIIQSPAADPDAITAMAPFLGTLVVWQSRRAYTLTHGNQPSLDAEVQVLAERGCLSQRTWAIYNRMLYVMDRTGIYSLSTDGQLEDLSLPIANLFKDAITLTPDTVAKMFLVIDQGQRILRAFVPFTEDFPTSASANNDNYPSRALCYSLDTKTWWMETYPAMVTQGATATLDAYASTLVMLRRTLYTTDRPANAPATYECKLARPGVGYTDICSGMAYAYVVTNPGSGRSVPPPLRSSSGVGRLATATVNGDASVAADVIESPGYGSTSASLAEVVQVGVDRNTSSIHYGYASSRGWNTCRIAYRYKTGNWSYDNDMVDAKAAGAQHRDVTLTYKSTATPAPILLRAHYNNAPYARGVTASRDRGVGFVYDTAECVARIDANKQYPLNTGVSKALIEGRTIDDIGSADRYVALKLNGSAPVAEPVIIYDLQAYGLSGQPQSE